MRNTRVSVLINKLGGRKVDDPILVDILRALNDDSRDVDQEQDTKITIEQGQQNFVQIGDTDYLNPDFSDFVTQAELDALDIPPEVDLNGLVKIFYKQSQTKSNAVTAETTLIAPNPLALAPSLLNALGKSLRIKAKGYFSNPVLGPTLNIRVSVGSCVLTTGARVLRDVSGNQFWEIDTIFTCYATGAAGQLIGQGGFHHVIS